MGEGRSEAGWGGVLALGRDEEFQGVLGGGNGKTVALKGMAVEEGEVGDDQRLQGG